MHDREYTKSRSRRGRSFNAVSNYRASSTEFPHGTCRATANDGAPTKFVDRYCLESPFGIVPIYLGVCAPAERPGSGAEAEKTMRYCLSDITETPYNTGNLQRGFGEIGNFEVLRAGNSLD